MTEVISVRFRGGCKAYYFSPGEETVKIGDEVIVDTAQGAEFGICCVGNHQVADERIVQPLRQMIRLATDADRRTVENNRVREKESFAICEKKIAEHGLDMKLVNVECSFEGNKIIFFFTADGRVDFRELVKDLAAQFHSRIELRQIGVRDESKMLGGLGICGRPFCCSSFLDDFQPVSIKMAKTQNLSLNPTKISGTCGRLMCCLKYEQCAYEDASKRMCRNDSFVQTPDGPGNVTAVNLVRETVTVRLDDAPEAPKNYSMGEIIVLRSGKGTRDGIDIPPRPERIKSDDPAEEEMMAAFENDFVRAATPAPDRKEQQPRRKDGSPRQQPQNGKPPRPQQKPQRDSQKRGPQEQQKPRQDTPPKQIVRFASNIPVAGNAAAPQDQQRRSRPHRRGRRRGHGGNGAPGGAPKAE